MFAFGFLEVLSFQRPLPTFKEVFRDKKDQLETGLSVSSNFLRKFMDAALIPKRDIESGGYFSAQEFLDLLESCDSTRLIEVCKILRENHNLRIVMMILPARHRVRYEVIPEELEAELENILEPDYGLPDKLYSNEVINDEQRAGALSEKPVQRRVHCLLQAVKEKWGSVKADCFLKSLEEDGQLHIVNFITGKDHGDVVPLNEQQRRRLLCLERALETLDTRGSGLIELLQKTNVLSALQVDDIFSRKSRETIVRRLIRILERKSVADVQLFIVCLDEAAQINVSDRFNEVGVVARVFTSISHEEMAEKDLLEKLSQFVQHFNNCFRSSEWLVASSLYEYMEKLEYEVVNVKVELEKQVTWYIMCRSVQSLESLRELHLSADRWLGKQLQWIFNCLHGGDERLQLSATWDDTDFQRCQTFLAASSSRPFDFFLIQDDEPLRRLELNVSSQIKSGDAVSKLC